MCLSPKEGLFSCTCLLVIIQPLVSVGAHLQIKTPQTNARMSPIPTTRAFSYTLLWVNFTRRSQKILTVSTGGFPECRGRTSCWLWATLLHCRLIRECPFPVLKRDSGLLHVSPLKCRLLLLLLNPKILCPERISQKHRMLWVGRDL